MTTAETGDLLEGTLLNLAEDLGAIFELARDMEAGDVAIQVRARFSEMVAGLQGREVLFPNIAKSLQAEVASSDLGDVAKALLNENITVHLAK